MENEAIGPRVSTNLFASNFYFPFTDSSSATETPASPVMLLAPALTATGVPLILSGAGKRVTQLPAGEDPHAAAGGVVSVPLVIFLPLKLASPAHVPTTSSLFFPNAGHIRQGL